MKLIFCGSASKNPQIINGCQTYSTIGEYLKNDTPLLFAKIIEVADTVENQDLIDGIIEANNRQNPINERILKSCHPAQVKLAREFETLGYYFERKEGQYKIDKEKSKFNPGMKVKNKDILRCNLAIEKNKTPNLCISLTEDELFSNQFDDVFKKNKTAKEYLIPYFILYWYIDGICSDYRGKSRKKFNKLAT